MVLGGEGVNQAAVTGSTCRLRSLFEKPKQRKNIRHENYTIEDYFQRLTVTFQGEKMVGPDAAIPLFRQQLAILAAVKARFESSLFDIRQLAKPTSSTPNWTQRKSSRIINSPGLRARWRESFWNGISCKPAKITASRL